MLKTILNTIPIEKNGETTLQDVECVYFANYTEEPVSLTYNNITRSLPPAQLVDGVLVPITFPIECKSDRVFDIKFSIKFALKNGLVLVDYFKPNQC